MHPDYDPQEIALANEIAGKLDDLHSIALHLKFARKYKSEFLRETLAKVLAVPDYKVQTSRAAIYVAIINRIERYGSARY
jgi:hypothetical protein